jgi:recombination protein RecT
MGVQIMLDQNQLNTLQTVTEILNKNKQAIEEFLPSSITFSQVLRFSLTELKDNYRLLNCKPQSIVSGIVRAAQLGLTINTSLGHASLSPLKNGDVIFIIGYRGLIELARRSGFVHTVTTRVVRDGDEFLVEYGLNENIIHRPLLKSENRELTHAYAVAKMTSGCFIFDVMDRYQIENIRQRSKTGNFGAWVTDYDEMARKTVVRRLIKYLPLTIEMAESLSIDDDVLADIEQPLSRAEKAIDMSVTETKETAGINELLS